MNDAYNMIDRFLRNELDDVDYAKYSAALDEVWLAQPQAAPAEPQPTCVWHQDGDETSDTWATRCGKYFSLNDGSPSENHMNYCHYCGKPLEEHPFTDEDADDAAGVKGDGNG